MKKNILKHNILFIIFHLLFNGAIYLSAQPVKRYYLNNINFNSQNGLPTNAVNCIFKDHKGIFWIGTQAGLCTYNGYEIELVKNNPKDSFTLKCSNIFTINEYQNFLLIGCEHGLSVYDYMKNKFIEINQVNKTLGDIPVYQTYVLNHRLFLAAKNGLYEYNLHTQQIKKYTYFKNIELNSSQRFFLNAYQFLIYSYNTDVLKIDTINYTLKKVETFDNNYGFNKLIDNGKYIYALCANHGVQKYDAKDLHLIENVLLFNTLNINLNKVSDFFIYKDKLYIAHSTGLMEYNPLNSEIQYYYLNEDINNDKINNIFTIDKNIYICSYFNGLYILPFSIIQINNPIPKKFNFKFQNSFTIQEIHNWQLLIGGSNFLYTYNILKNNIDQDYSKHFKNTLILCSALNNETAYIGTWGNGIMVIDLHKNKINKIIKNEKIKDVMSLYLDNRDTLWIGTIGEGLYKYAIKSGHIIKDNLFGENSINYIKKDEKNNYWIATSDMGLYKMNTKYQILLHLNKEKGTLPDNYTYHFTEDSNYIYIATDYGLTLYDKSKNKSIFYYQEDGLPSNTILSVIKDKKNNLWISTLKGISKMNINYIHQPNKKLFYNYSYLEGLVNHEFNQNAQCILKNGILLYGGTSGIDVINPNKIKTLHYDVPVIITSFRKNGKEIHADTNVVLKKFFEIDWKQNNFQIEITAINPLGSSDILYKYKLEGYDEEYSAPSNIRHISYTELPGGTYKLLILATNHQGEWNETPYYIYIKITPPFWKTSWFIISTSILLFGGIFGINQYRTYRIKEKNKELEIKVKERTKELETKNHEILSSIEYAKRIQQAILPSNKDIQSILPNAFILYIPKDIVSGDFYWLYQVNQPLSTIVAAIDCTGHGVPGALMSMIGNNLLNQIIIEKNISSPECILNELNKGVQTALKQGHSDIITNDGMDASIVQIFPNNLILWSGAYRPLIIIKKNKELIKLEGNKYPIGGIQLNEQRNFQLQQLQLEKDDTLYLFSDGYADQFGGDKGKKMMMKKFTEILLEIHHLPIQEQKTYLENFFYKWKADYEQVDDVLVIGIKI